MILPGKHLVPDRALLSIGGDILSVLTGPSHVSDLWEGVQALRSERVDASPLGFDWFVLALSLLYALGAVDHVGELVTRTGS